MVQKVVILIVLIVSGIVAQGDLSKVMVRNNSGNMVEMIRCATADMNPETIPHDILTPRNNGENSTVLGRIGVAFHIITSSSGAGMVDYWQLEAQIDSMNAAFEDAGVSFFITHVDTIANDAWYNVDYESPEEAQMKQALAIDPATTLNYYWANLGQGLLGWATFPWMFPEESFMHGVVCLNESAPGGNAVPFNLGATGTHEVGHYVGLYHTFQGGCSAPGDEVDDTPAEASPASGCPIGRDTCPSPGEDPIHNFMDYSSDACMYEFTPGQFERMEWALAMYKPNLLELPLAPEAPEMLTAYSDYTMASEMALQWNDPQSILSGDTLSADAFHIVVERNGEVVDSIPGGVQSFLDSGLVDGEFYRYLIYAVIDSNGLSGGTIETAWIAGGSPTPNGATNFNLSGNDTQIQLYWDAPATNIDGTPMDDYAGINLYRGEEWVATIERSSSDTASSDTAIYDLPEPGYFDWFITVLDNEDPANESEPSQPLGTPLSVPFIDNFNLPGEPNSGTWLNRNAEVNDKADNPPSGGYALNLNGHPIGSDTLDLKPIDLSGVAGSGMVFSYYYQAQGLGNMPQPGDSLLVYFKNSEDEWVPIVGYDGMPLQPFTREEIALDDLDAGAGTFFHSQFQVRFRSIGGTGFFPNDDWFIDDLQLTNNPVAVADIPGNLPKQFAVSANYPNPFNPSTTIRYELPITADVNITIYNTLGQQVRVLLDDQNAAGQYEIQWDGRDANGHPVASGLYLYRFESTQFQQTQKMILLK